MKQCVAQTSSRPAKCYSIKNMDRQYFCLAQLDERPAKCYAIRAIDLRQECLAMFSR